MKYKIQYTIIEEIDAASPEDASEYSQDMQAIRAAESGSVDDEKMWKSAEIKIGPIEPVALIGA